MTEGILMVATIRQKKFMKSEQMTEVLVTVLIYSLLFQSYIVVHFT